MKLMVLDGNSVINRAYYGVRALTTRDGFFTNAIYGFLNILEKLRADEKPDALCVAFDLKAPTFRHLKYDGYKATRHPMPDELAMQMPVMKDVRRPRSPKPSWWKTLWPCGLGLRDRHRRPGFFAADR